MGKNKIVKRKVHPNSLANLTHPPAPQFTSTYQPNPESLRVPKRANRQEMFQAFFDSKSKDPKTGEECNKLAAIISKAWRMFMEKHEEDDVKPTEFMAYWQFVCDGYFGKQTDKLVIEEEKSLKVDDLNNEKIFETVKYLTAMLDMNQLEEFFNWLEIHRDNKRSVKAIIVND